MNNSLRVTKPLIKTIIITVFGIVISCSDNNYEIEYANGYPSKLAGNWVAFQFHGGDLDGQISGPYDMVTALDANRKGYLIIDNIFNTNVRIRAEIRGDTGFYANNTEQLEVINMGGYGIESISIDGYSNNNPVLVNFLYRLAASSFENIAFSESDMTEIIFFRAGLYDAQNAPVDTIMVMGYRKTGFEDVGYN